MLKTQNSVYIATRNTKHLPHLNEAKPKPKTQNLKLKTPKPKKLFTLGPQNIYHTQKQNLKPKNPNLKSHATIELCY